MGVVYCFLANLGPDPTPFEVNGKISFGVKVRTGPFENKEMVHNRISNVEKLPLGFCRHRGPKSCRIIFDSES